MNHYNSTFKIKPGKGLKKTPLKRTGFKPVSFDDVKNTRRKTKAKPKRSTELQDHFDAVIKLGPPPGMEGDGRLTIHHCHSGSMSDNGYHRGVSQKPSDWLVIALPESLHTGSNGIDSGTGVLTWENRYGSQYEALEWVCDKLGINVFERVKRD